MKKTMLTALSALLIIFGVIACGGAPAPTPSTPDPIPGNPDPDPIPDPAPFVNLRTGQAASLVIGQDDFVSDSEGDSDKYFGAPYGNPLVVNGALYLPDYGVGRVLGYLQVPTENGAAADFVLGKVDFDDVVDGPSDTALHGPQSAFTDGSNLYILDYSDNRIVRYDGFPTTSGAAMNLAIGQPDLATGDDGCSATRFNDPEGATIAGGRLIVADDDNSRVLIWNSVPTDFDVPADIVLGQVDMDSCAAPGDPTARALKYPTDVWSDGTRLLVVDGGHERILLWNEFPTENNAPADIVLGQPDMSTDGSGVGADKFGGPYYLASNGTQIAVSDVNSHRVLVWNEFPTENGAPADVVLGQIDFDHFGADAGASGPTSTGFNYPTGLLFHDNLLFVGDNNNSRYLIFEGF